MRGRNTLIFKLRGVLMVPPVVFLVVIFFGETEQRMLVWPAGLFLFGAGVALRIWAQMHLHYRLPVHKKLTATGPYTYVRNPIYAGNTAILLGLTVLSELLWFLPFMLLWCMAVYGLVIRREEEHLLTKYGEPYAAYLRETPRWIPRPGRLHAARIAVAKFFWPSVVAELHCLLWLIPLVGKEVFSTFQ